MASGEQQQAGFDISFLSFLFIYFLPRRKTPISVQPAHCTAILRNRITNRLHDWLTPDSVLKQPRPEIARNVATCKMIKRLIYHLTIINSIVLGAYPRPAAFQWTQDPISIARIELQGRE